MVRSISVIYSTATGHTEFVVDILLKLLSTEFPSAHIVKQRAEVSQPEDLKKSDVLVLACGSWNTGNVEGQLSPYMHELLMQKAQKEDLQGVFAAAIGLGDDRYFFTARAAEKLTEYLTGRGASLLLPTLKIINDPFDQEKKVAVWAKELMTAMKKIPTTPKKS